MGISMLACLAAHHADRWHTWTYQGLFIIPSRNFFACPNRKHVREVRPLSIHRPRRSLIARRPITNNGAILGLLSPLFDFVGCIADGNASAAYFLFG
jgi:hypothetical protein